jgi:VWFA-related protein
MSLCQSIRSFRPALILFGVFSFISSSSVAQQLLPQQKTPPPSTPLVRVGSEEVLLDIVVRDKKGRPVLDLKESEIEIYENGVKQVITSFRPIDRIGSSGSRESRTVASSPPSEERPKSTTPDPLREINLVTMVFERLNNESRILARQAASDFLKSDLGENVFVSVYYLDLRLRLLQPFTADRERLSAAIESATGKGATQFADKSDQLRREMENMIRGKESSANPQNGGPGVDPGPSAANNAIELKVAEIAVNTLRFEDEIQRQEQGTASTYSLLALVGGQNRLYGRKTVLYFSEGLQIPPNLVDLFHTTISAANRANISFYTVDARGLLAARQNETMRDELMSAARSSETQQRARAGQAVTVDQVKIFDTAESSIRRNTQNTLAELAESTGGFLIANTNDLRKPLQRVASELGRYYEVTYSPQLREYDGKYHSIAVKPRRSDLVIQTRNGYFALPPNEGSPVLPFELPMLGALNAKPLPRDFDYHVQALRFALRQVGLQHMLVMEVPLSNLTFQTDQEKKIYRTHFSLLALIKNAEGSIVHKFGQDSPLEGPIDRLESLKRGNVVFVRNFWLPPGRYTLETVVRDWETGKLSARRAVTIVPAPKQGVSMSSVTVIKRIDPVDPNVKDPDNPMRFAKGKIVPYLGEGIQFNPEAQLSFFFVVYPMAGALEKPHLTLEFLRDGEVIARATPELPQPDEQGQIPYITSVPIQTFKAGRYEVRVVVKQGEQSTEEHTFFNIN